ncbi:Alpha/beta-hydrolase [Mycena venus]|uniref:Carboxylic ester hydrolase n=1 Tax=Mycena venus TaxID=2733690 RepID=A0A8H6XQB7_9AGAR|nr:Alpha/beta-hydrolase [Mycena venus]
MLPNVLLETKKTGNSDCKRPLLQDSFKFLLLKLSLLPATLGSRGPIVNTTSGSYIGVHDADNNVDVFKGIRYASPPKRFTPAAPIATKPKGLQSAVAFGADCPQPPLVETGGVALGPPLQAKNQSEDCLFLNIWRPASASIENKLPIQVYLHGSGLFEGSGSEWDGTGLVRRSITTHKPIIFITFNYRLGVLGFIGSAQAPNSALNVGLQDQRRALRWIQDNAANFGGDASRVTISGESAGARSVHLHYFFPDSRKTFRAGISSSGTSQAPGTVPCEWHDRPGGGYTILSNITGCGSGATSFRCLQDLPFDTFWPLALSTYQPPVGSRPPWSMVCKGPQGSFIDEYPSKKALDGDFLNLPIITGTNLNEGNLLIGASFLNLSPQPSIEEENSILSGFIAGQSIGNVSQDTITELLRLYAQPERVSNSTLYDRAAEWFTDIGFLAPQRQFLKVASAKQRNQNVWAYSFQQQLPGFPAFLGGKFLLQPNSSLPAGAHSIFLLNK